MTICPLDEVISKHTLLLVVRSGQIGRDIRSDVSEVRSRDLGRLRR